MAKHGITCFVLASCSFVGFLSTPMHCIRGLSEERGQVCVGEHSE